MRIVTVRPPWAQLIVNYGKDVENRVRNIAGDYRGPVAIHVGLRPVPAGDPAWWKAAAAGMDTDRYDGDDLHLGAIIGVVDLVDVTPWTSHTDAPTSTPGVVLRVPRQPVGWEMRDHWHLRLANPRPLADPIPYRGALGLRHLDDDTTARILAQIGDPNV